MGMLDSVFGGGGSSIPDYAPIEGTSGLGSITYDKSKGITASLDPKYQALVQELLASRSLSPESIALGQQATQAGAGFLSAASSTDPFAMAEEQFNRLEAILQPGRERERTALEERLLSQGRLGSTGGGITEGAFQEAIEQSKRQNLYEAFGQAQGVQRQQAELAQGFGAFGISAEQAQLQRMLQALGGATATEAMPVTTLGNYLATLSGQKQAQDIAQAEAEASAGGFGDILSGALSAGLSAYTGGLGKSLAPKAPKVG